MWQLSRPSSGSLATVAFRNDLANVDELLLEFLWNIVLTAVFTF